MKHNKAICYRIYPDEGQEALIAKTFGCCRFVYNAMLSDKKACYIETKKMLKTTPAQYKEKFPFLKDVDSLALCNEQLNLEAAYKNFFENEKSGFPNYKSKKRDKDSYSTNLVNGNIEIGDGYIKLPKLGIVKASIHRQAPEGYRLKRLFSMSK